jgi:hypothetical protein
MLILLKLFYLYYLLRVKNNLNKILFLIIIFPKEILEIHNQIVIAK